MKGPNFPRTTRMLLMHSWPLRITRAKASKWFPESFFLIGWTWISVISIPLTDMIRLLVAPAALDCDDFSPDPGGSPGASRVQNKPRANARNGVNRLESGSEWRLCGKQVAVCE